MSRAHSRIWFITPSSALAEVRTLREYSATVARDEADGQLSSSSVSLLNAWIELSGVRSSWLMCERKLRGGRGEGEARPRPCQKSKNGWG